jgi:hypothetical protein
MHLTLEHCGDAPLECLTKWFLKSTTAFLGDADLNLPWYFGVFCWNYVIAGIVMILTRPKGVRFPFVFFACLLIFIQGSKKDNMTCQTKIYSLVPRMHSHYIQCAPLLQRHLAFVPTIYTCHTIPCGMFGTEGWPFPCSSWTFGMYLANQRSIHSYSCWPYWHFYNPNKLKQDKIEMDLCCGIMCGTCSK